MLNLCLTKFCDEDVYLTRNNKSLDLVSLCHSWREKHVNRNCCDGGRHTCTSLFLFAGKDILRGPRPSPPFRGSWESVTSFSSETFLLSGDLLLPAGTSQKSLGKLRLWSQSFLSLSEKHSKDREYLFLDRRVILHSYTCHRGNKSNICTIRRKLRVRRAGRWGFEFVHLSCAVSLYRLILGTWMDLCNLIISAVDAGYYQHLWYPHENTLVAGLRSSTWSLASAESHRRWSGIKLQFVISRMSVWQL